MSNIKTYSTPTTKVYPTKIAKIMLLHFILLKLLHKQQELQSLLMMTIKFKLIYKKMFSTLNSVHYRVTRF
jgi:hypothetical protein